ncbi:MAG: hypothetical protein IKS00_03130 [Bacteroidales bacterium]|nr:hypothetical protein [Bacteroidales bacterium]
MKLRIICALIAFFFTMKLSAQSDDGWFTNKITTGINYNSNNCGVYVRYAYLFNFENHFSAGTQTGLVFSEQKMIPIEASLRIRPLGKKNIMPAFTLSGGYGANISKGVNGGGIWSPCLSIETGYLRRVRYVTDVGVQFYKKEKYFVIALGIEL